MDLPAAEKKSIRESFVDKFSASFPVSGYLFFLLLSFVTGIYYNWGLFIPSSCLLIALTCHSTIVPDQRVTSIAYGMLLLSCVGTLGVYQDFDVIVFCKSPFPQLLSTHPTMKPVGDALQWTCDSVNSSEFRVWTDSIDKQWVHKSNVLSLQRRLLEVIRLCYTDMGADKQVVDLLSVVVTQLEKGDFTKLDSFDMLLPRGSADKKHMYPY